MENKHTLEEIRARLEKLPIGYISKKTINGKIRYYHQWKENGKLKSKYLKKGEEIALQEQINERKALQAEEKELSNGNLPSLDNTSLKLNTNAILGRNLLVFGEGADKFQKRDCYSEIEKIVPSEETEDDSDVNNRTGGMDISPKVDGTGHIYKGKGVRAEGYEQNHNKADQS